MPKECPDCQLLCPDDEIRCDCGFNFIKTKIKKSYLPPSMRIKATSRTIKWAIIFIVALLFLNLLYPFIFDQI